MPDEKDTKHFLNVTTAEKKMEKIIMKWFMEEPMMLEAINMFKKVPSNDQHTIGIDTKTRPAIIKYNPNFINTLSKERLECVLAMEGFKILLKHVTTRLCNPSEMSSLASNITITPFSLGNILKKNDMEDFYPLPEVFGLERDKCFEEYFREIMDRQDETNEKIKKIWNSMSKEEKEKALEDAMNNSQGEKGEEEGKDGKGFKEFKNPNDAMKEYFDPNSTNSKDWGENCLLDADIKSLVNENKDRRRQWGNIGGKMIDQILSAHTPKISWKEIVRRFNKSVISMRRYCSRMKLNRRYGLAQPGQRREYDTNIIFAIDSSGSMSNNDIAEGLAVINSVCGHAKITYILFDTKITSIEKNVKKAKNSFKITGRGGTDFQDIVDYADKASVDGLVIFTDGCASCPTQPIKAKVLWLLHSKDRGLTPPYGCTWGNIAYLERYE